MGRPSVRHRERTNGFPAIAWPDARTARAAALVVIRTRSGEAWKPSSHLHLLISSPSTLPPQLSLLTMSIKEDGFKASETFAVS